jgi:hypothetical protein
MPTMSMLAAGQVQDLLTPFKKNEGKDTLNPFCTNHRYFGLLSVLHNLSTPSDQ